MYSLLQCKWCILAKELLKSNGIPYKVKEIDINKKHDFKNAMRFKTFPLMFIVKGQRKIRLGGYQELVAMINIRNSLNKNNVEVDKLKVFNKLIDSLNNDKQLKTLFDTNYTLNMEKLSMGLVEAFMKV